MKFSDLLDQMAGGSGDDSGTYRNDARRWLNLARSEIANSQLWKMALRTEATFTTSAATTSGIYSLADSGQSSSGFEFVHGDTLYDQTNKFIVTHETLALTAAVDVAKETTGPPTYWADAGADVSGVRQIYLWPVPAGTYTILFHGYRMLDDVAAADDDLSVDRFFGPISPWAACFNAGMRYYHDEDNNEDVNQMMLTERRFRRAVARRRTQNRLSVSGSLQQRIVSSQNVSTLGRFDPAHYPNRA